MNYGDGWYGGVFIGAMYSLAFTTKDIRSIVSEALSTIPTNTKFRRCIAHGKHQIKVRVLNSRADFELNTTEYIIYSDQFPNPVLMR